MILRFGVNTMWISVGSLLVFPTLSGSGLKALEMMVHAQTQVFIGSHQCYSLTAVSSAVFN